ncbi:UbiA prenyltransferase family protein [Parachryseolinea silvisoli]|uniref:UbiA prenyltransferase family protein n=1 Tax=Parachryseolinea silvisoli TaxID=2873601 RepID=UPI002265F8B0|nr:UbiA prenyltransferase family protein [Parachryseolinea silvisoli]MCD9017736.1 UbiA prenyltransferase family protein [Parachryseolinea silvisoli]
MKYLRLVRAHQWIKNSFLFFPLFFAGDLLNIPQLLSVAYGFLAFSLVASSIYILNDYNDIEADRQHPTKSKRPLASGEISKTTGLVIMVITLASGLFLAYSIDIRFLYVTLIYYVLNLGYSLGLKHISILDILIVASGFLLRTVAGGVIAQVRISEWLMLMVFLLAVFLALAKRRDDILLAQESGKVMRKASAKYNMDFVNGGLTMLMSVILVCYIMYTISDEVTDRLKTHYLYATAIFVIAGLMRYMQITVVENKSGSPTRILYTDRFLQITLLGWIVSFFSIIYRHNLMSLFGLSL